MSDILVAADEDAVTELLHDAETTLGTLSRSGPGNLGPFTANWGASAFLAGGAADLIPPNVIRIVNCELHYSLHFSFSLNLNNILPSFCLPQICIPIPFLGRVCTPRICISWPTITIPVNYSDLIRFTSDFTLNAHLSGPTWLIDVVIVGVPNLQISVGAAAILGVLGLAAAAILASIPFIGPLLAGAVLLITAAVGIAGITGFMGPILGLFLSGLTLNIYKQPKLFTVLPFSPPFDAAVRINLDAIAASVSRTDEDELLITADISA